MSRRPKPSEPPTLPAIRLTAHPPERQRRTDPVRLPCACCCCCCCCLHSVGSLIGGIMGSTTRLNLPPREINDPDFPFPFRRDELEEEGAVLPAAILYWLLLSFLLSISALWSYVASTSRAPEDLLVGLAIGLGLLPLLQLGASLLAMIAVFLFYADRPTALARVGKITLYSFVGGMIGLGLLGLFCGLLSLPGMFR